ncbi:MAG: hypothetical protein Q9208_003979 [Pyrenodesmia sp. 3 TL-2023]
MTELGPIFVRLGLAQYLEPFLDEGFETWETVLDITESDLNAAQREAQLDAGDREGPSQADGSRRAKRKYKRHPKTDPNPHMSSSPTVQVRDDLKPENLSFTVIAKRVGEMWQALEPDEREPFEAQAASAKEEYLAELAKYKETDHYKEYSEYLADFKATHSSKPGV